MENIINIIYNNKTYSIYKYSTTESLISLEELLQLPLTFWLLLLNKKNKYCRLDDLLKVLAAKIKAEENKTKAFIFKDKHYWLSKNIRSNIKNLLELSSNDFELVLSDCIVQLSNKAAKKFIDDLEMFAYKCFLNTLKHLNNLKSYKSVEELILYDYTKGYPDKIILNGTELNNN